MAWEQVSCNATQSITRQGGDCTAGIGTLGPYLYVRSRTSDLAISGLYINTIIVLSTAKRNYFGRGDLVFQTNLRMVAQPDRMVVDYPPDHRSNLLCQLMDENSLHLMTFCLFLAK